MAEIGATTTTTTAPIPVEMETASDKANGKDTTTKKDDDKKPFGYLTDEAKERLEQISKDKDNKLKLDRSKMDKNGFLKLMMTQLQHQDPLSPMDNKDFIAQMAQFSSVEQMANIAKNTEQSAEKTESIQNSIASLTTSLTELREDMKLLTGRDDTKPVDTNSGNVKETLDEVKELNQKLLNEMIKLNKAIEAFG